MPSQDRPGFALESFDVIGGWRDHYRATGEPKEENGRRVRFWNGFAVDPGDTLPDGRSFRDIDEFNHEYSPSHFHSLYGHLAWSPLAQRLR